MGLLRLVGLAYGLLVAAGVLTTRHALTRVVDGLEQHAPPVPVEAEPAPGRTVARVQLVLGALGVVVLGVGLVKVTHAVLPVNYVWLLVWLAGGIVLHDGVLAPVLSVLRIGSERGLRGRPRVVGGLLKAGFVIGGLLVLVVVPAIWSKHLGVANPTVLPGNYALRLVVALSVVAAGTLAAVAVALVRERARGGRTVRPTGS